MAKSKDELPKQLLAPSRVIGIGASAGGLEALEQLFDHLPSGTGMAFVVLQHLSPHYKSFMAELLTRHTSMVIKLAEDGMVLMPDSIYLLPPKKRMSILNGRLLLEDQTTDGNLSMPIDHFLCALAKDQGERTVGIILSGSGNDGTRGVTALKNAGGIVLVQDTKSAKYDGMPNSAIMSGAVDEVLTPQEIGRKLVELSLAAKLEEPLIPLAVDQLPKQQRSDVPIRSQHLGIIFELLKGATGIDFSSYKSGSVLRRIERRSTLCGMASLKQYIEYLQDHPEELTLLQKDLLIGVTHFFRDPEAFELLQNRVLPELFKKKGANKEIRIWVAGCSTGEEAYSLAIMLRQYMEQLDQYYDVKIFATDLDKESLDIASQGTYTKRSITGVPSDLLDKYFTKINNTYQVNKEIRKLIVFAPHNVIKDPPFINLDLVTCRNMLIYLQPEMQRKVITLFHFALHSTGYLFLGPSETVGKLSHMFNEIDKKWNIYQYKETDRSYAAGTFGVEDKGDSTFVNRKNRFTKQEPKSSDPLQNVMGLLVRDCLPPFILIDENNEIIHTSGRVGDILKMPEGRPSHNVLKLLSPSLATTIGSAIHKARKDQSEVHYSDLSIPEVGVDKKLKLRVKPLDTESGSSYLALFFDSMAAEAKELPPGRMDEIPQDVQRRIRDLEQELQHAEEYLQASIEELETSNEELQATNEELIAANEEMQSTNEELQSLNEELVTVNNEHQSKIQELTELNSDLDNLLISTKIGTVFLDKKMCVRRFTPSITEEINLLDVDIGRPLAHISHHFRYGSLVKDAQKVLKNVVPLEKEIQSKRGKWYMMRMLPYWLADKQVDGVVVTFSDITELKKANEGLQLMSHAIEQSPSIIVIADPKGNIEYVNPRFTECTGYTWMEVTGKSIRWLHRNDPEVSKQIWDAVSSGTKWEGELESITKDGEPYWERSTIIPIKNEEGVFIHYLQVGENITEHKQTEEALRKSELLSAVGQLAAGIAHEIRNPLTALKGFTKLMGSQTGGNRYTDIMADELDRIETIISELLILAKPQAVQFHEKDLVNVVQEVVMLLDTQAIMNNVQIQSDYKLESCPVLCIDNQLKQVFINLVKNAIEAMPQGGYIKVTMEAAGSEAVITVADNGVGIPPDKLQRLGQPFFTTKQSGTGLGLMMSYKIVENHNGSMKVTSKVGAGTTFQVRVPLSLESGTDKERVH